MSFWDRVLVTGPDDCWEWQGPVSSKGGHGKCWHDGKHAVPHRLAYEDANGPIAGGLVVMHQCDNPRCCNPAHLKLGTHSENMREMHSRGRHRIRQGSTAPRELGIPRCWIRLSAAADE